MIKNLFRYNLLFILLLLIIFPSALLISQFTFGNKIIPKKMTDGYKLTGMTVADNGKFQFDFTNIFNRHNQIYLENWIADHLPLRSFLIRMNNQFYFSFFKKSYSANGSIIIGKKNQLFEEGYIDSYCRNHFESFDDDKKLALWADQIKDISDYFTNKGKVFIYLMTPSKAEYMPNALPKRFQCQNSGLSNHIKRMAQLLDERKINYVNGPQLVIDATNNYHVPMFNEGGVHWNELANVIAANELLNKINEAHIVKIEPLHFQFQITKAFGFSKDLLNLLNLLHPNTDYFVPSVNVNADFVTKKPTISFVGGSFCGGITIMLQKGLRFSEIRYFQYLKLAELNMKGKTMNLLPVNMNSVIADISTSDVIVLEENSALTISNHAQLFYDMLIKHKIAS